ncbi:type-F conjugative transfer system mating-pair stabilization protein TraN [Vibrio coralliilyticus]|uniref:type-F conjugative transfer system mating-pair stabilization protein TraN n=2 Tax=Vibrio coralliilyticus TaxID=190893 RepID=UPI0009B85C06|nr:type-F conjugative transfer system mating-pair stabilization protein TraN [Vibrio coralliilyticus]NOH54943.1 type-F conjugative transfer system mating-pair stabilization protein TraN [Vibrio coralliilyticus]
MTTKAWLFGMFVISATCGATSTKQNYDAAVPSAQRAQHNIHTRLPKAWTPNQYCESAECQRARQTLPKADEDQLRRSSEARVKQDPQSRSVLNTARKTTPDPAQDPAYQYATVGQEHANAIVHGTKDAQIDCRQQTQCTTRYQSRVCRQPTLQSVACLQKPIATIERGPVHYTCPTGWQRNGSVCHRTKTQCLYSGADYVLEKGGTGWCASRGQWFRWHGQAVSPEQGYAKGALKRQTSGASCHGSRWRRRFEICGPLKETRPADPFCEPGDTLVAGDCVHNRIQWRSTCDDLGDCQLTSKTCSEGPGTRTVNGIPTHLSCWAYRHTYQCRSEDECRAYGHCQIGGSRCAERRHGICTRRERDLRCPFKQCSPTRLVCGSPSFCLDGECYRATPSQSASFAKTASALSALARAGRRLGQPPRIFAGQAAHCSEKPIGFANCCQDGGWGTKSGLTQCSREAQAIGRAKQLGTSVYLGRYCAHSVLGVCTRYKQGYCLYDSVLAKIIQQQGAAQQLGITLGTAAHPVCPPLTAQQLQRINFNRIDFSSYYRTLKARMRLPKPEHLVPRSP